MDSSLCICHTTCASCIALDDGFVVYTGSNDCINCADPRYTLNPYWSDGTGSCEVVRDDYDYSDGTTNDSSSYYESTDTS